MDILGLSWLLTVFQLVMFIMLGNCVDGQLVTPDAWVCRFPSSSNSKMQDETHPHPRDCFAYIACQNGYPRVMTCLPGMYYEPSSKKCGWPTKQRITQCEGNISAYTNRVCSVNPVARIPLPDTCALYLDCSLVPGNPAFYDRMLECPYPDLFSDDLGRCVKFRFAKCRHRPIPVAPCDYLQYQQSCTSSSGCLPCHQRHPSCRFKANGPHPVAQHSNLFQLCVHQRTLDVRRCLGNYQFHPAMRKCVPVDKRRQGR